MIYRHLSRLPKGFTHPWQYCDLAARRHICDRFHMSEIAYSYARGEESSPLCPDMYRLLDGWLRGMGTFTVIITGGISLLQERYDKLAEREMYNFDVIKRANEAFKTIIAAKNDGQSIGSPASLCKYGPVDFDMSFYVWQAQPFVTKEEEDRIVREYLLRQNAVTVMSELVGVPLGVRNAYGIIS